MFYSQFILAKKGPLGTIWIAAHLERKLRKNQVADTDIGVSVDSILFPDVPIALRLSSHLLLGVVRIYSRKVNYLFDDCSEALLKIKQAFRSSAVDLPPEESTAPYHSITLPETFDLDDFELPDNDIFQGNYVDHHISTREQITLQDTMEGVVYSTSQFGLDERFGDGDTSQVRLDLEEELLLDQATVTRKDEISRYAQASVGPIPHPEMYASHGRMAGPSEDMPLNGTTSKISDRVDGFEVVDYADAPSTPGLVEPNVSSVKEGLACDDHLDLEEHNLREMMGKTDNQTSESDFNHREVATELPSGDTVHRDNLVSMSSEKNHHSGELEINQDDPEVEFLSAAETTEQIPADESVCAPVELDKLEDKNEVVSWSNEQTISSIGQINGERGASEVRLPETDNVEPGGDIKVRHSNGNATIATKFQSLEFASAQENANVEAQDCQGLADHYISNHNNNNEQAMSTCSAFLRPCNSQPSQLIGSSPVSSSVAEELQSVDAEPLQINNGQRDEGHVLENSTKVQGQDGHVSGGIQSEVIRIFEPTLNGEILEDGGKQDEQLDDVITNDKQSEDLSTAMTSELHAPEKLLSAPDRLLDEPCDLLIETPEKVIQEEGDGSEAGTKITGKKRSFTESSLTVQSLNSVDPFGLVRSRGTVESIPEDDDLLSSILVGRKLSVLKMKPSPTASEAPSSKRARSASRPSAFKRKVLVDDSMVLHGDTIRQQLNNTEDIRRLRKKAPCTRAEILMIQRQFLEDKIFNKPLSTGMSVELTRLHNEAFDLSRARVCENDDNIQASFELVGAENSGRKNVNDEGKIGGSLDVVIFTNDADGQPSEFPVQNGNQQVEDHSGSHDINFQDHRNITLGEIDLRSSAHGNLRELAEIEGHRVNFDVAAATDSTVIGIQTLHSGPMSGEISVMPTDTVEQYALTVDIMQIDTLNLSADEVDIHLSEETFLRDAINIVAHDGIVALDQSVEKSVSDGTELRTEEEIPLDETKTSASDEQLDGSSPNDNVNASLANASSFNGECRNLNSVNAEQVVEGIENDKNSVHIEDVDFVMSSECIHDKDQNSNPLCDDESKTYPIWSVGYEGDLENTSVNHGDHFTGQESDYQNFTDAENSLHQVAAGDCDNILGASFANDTEFLNVDDDDLGEDDDENMPNSEDACLLENSGWSSRTRAVAKYLQSLFDKEAEHGRKVLSLDSLLAGKTRKESSRMFFETLVLKTRDYIQVEQPQPFDNLRIKARSKLMKLDF